MDLRYAASQSSEAQISAVTSSEAEISAVTAASQPLTGTSGWLQRPLAAPPQLYTSSTPSRALLTEPVQLVPVEAYRGGAL